MIYKTIEKNLDETLKFLKKEFEKNNISILSIEEKKEGKIQNIKLLILTAEKDKKVFKVSLIEKQGKTIASIIFPKKVFSEKEKDLIKNLLNKV
ncbi:MAG: hypothetical protein GXO21_05185 [Aquificae bacterium]|nr:hypothetical protein [Aquificota bacterium]